MTDLEMQRAQWESEKADLLAKLASAQARTSAPRPLTLKVSEKRGVSLYGLNAVWPVTLYAGQWEKLLAFKPQIEAFIAQHNGALSRK